MKKNTVASASPKGRFPANTILTYDETDFDEVCDGFPYNQSKGSNPNYEKTNQNNTTHLYTNIKSGYHFEDSGSACRYFYNAKTSKKDRDEGLDSFEYKKPATTEYRPFLNKMYEDGLDKYNDFLRLTPKKNVHPTVKPTSLMQYLIKLVTPKGETVLDPFNGSGSTGKACMFENKERNANYKYIGIELTEEYLPISEARIKYAINFKDEKLNNNKKGKVVSKPSNETKENTKRNKLF